MPYLNAKKILQETCFRNHHPQKKISWLNSFSVLVPCSQCATFNNLCIVFWSALTWLLFILSITDLYPFTLYGCLWMSCRVCMAAVLLVSYACGQLSSLLASSSVLHLYIYACVCWKWLVWLESIHWLIMSRAWIS